MYNILYGGLYRKNNEIQNTLKKIFTVVIILIIISSFNTILLISHINSNSTSTNTNEPIISDYDTSAFTEIKASDIKAKTKDTTSVIYIGRSTCSWCAEYLPILTEATEEYDLNTLYIDIAKIIDFNENKIIDQNSYDIIIGLDTVSEFENYMSEDFGSTPMTLIVKDGKILDAQTGYMKKDDLDNLLEKNNLKK